MKNSLTKKLILSILSIAFAVVSLGTTTFAWFTLSSTADLEAFTGDVKVGEGFEVAVTKVNEEVNTSTKWYTNTVPAEAIEATYKGAGLFDKFDAVSVTSTTDPLTAVQIIEVSGDTTSVSAIDTATAKKKMIAFKLHFRLASEGTRNVTIEDLTVTGTPKKWRADQSYALTAGNDELAGLTVNAGDEITYDVASASRVGFFNKDNNHVYETKEVNPSETDAGNTLGTTSKVGALDYFKNKNALTATPVVPTEATKPLVSTAYVAGDTVCTLTGTAVSTVTVAVWVEGWDAECMNAIFSQKLTVQMGFELQPE